MGRGKVVNTMTTPEWIEQINPKNTEFLKDFMEYCDTTKSDRTLYEYKCDLLIAFCWCLNHIDNKVFTEWTKRDIQKYQNYLINDCHLSPARVRRLKAVLSSLSNYIETICDDEYPDFRNIITKIPNPPLAPKLTKTVFTEDEVDDLLDYLTKNGKYCKACLVALAAFSGRRKSELIQFKVSDFTDDTLVCNGALYKSAPIRTKGRGKQGKMLECYTLAKNFKPYLDNWMKYRQEHGIESEWLFPSPMNSAEHITRSSVDSWYDEFSLLGKPFYLHSLRHNFTTRLLKAGIPALVIKDLIGWSDVSIISTYNDTNKDEIFSKYFDQNGIKNINET